MWNLGLDYFKIYGDISIQLYLLHKFVLEQLKILILDEKAIPLHAIPQIFNCFLFFNYSGIACNEMAQAEATIERNFEEFRLETLKDGMPDSQRYPQKLCLKEIKFELSQLYNFEFGKSTKSSTR